MDTLNARGSRTMGDHMMPDYGQTEGSNEWI